MIYGVSTVSDGNMAFQHGPAEAVLENRRKFLDTFGLSLEKTVVSNNQHGDNIVVLTESDASAGALLLDGAPKADALITSTRGLVLFLLTADCIPLLLIDKSKSVIALLHVSWKTATLGLPAKVVRLLMERFSLPPEEVRALFGPSIQKNSYVLPHPLEQENDPTWKPFLESLSSGEVAIDLVGFTAKQLEQAGMMKESVIFSPTDTAQSPDFFSHYRSVHTGEPEGRFATVASL